MSELLDTRPYAELARFIQQNSDMPARIFPSSSLAACLRMTIDGVGIGMLPVPIIAEMLKAGDLIEVQGLQRPADLRFTASFPSSPFNPVSEKAATLACEVAHNYPA
jgi:DNA-binding transcriptional LysR family regulator